MARRKQLRRRASQTSSSSSSSTSPSPSGPPSPSVTRAPAGASAAGGGCYSPGQTLAAARASLRQSTSLVDRRLPSYAVSAGASASSAPAEAAAALPAFAVLEPVPTEAAQVDASADASGAVSAALAAAAADILDGPHPDQDSLVLAACRAQCGPGASQAEEANSPMLADPAESQPADERRLQHGNAQPDMDPIISQQGNAQAGAEVHIAPQPTGCLLPVSVPGSWVQSGAQETVSSCTPLIGMSPSAVHQSTSSSVSGHACVTPAVKPHPRTAFAKPGSHQSVVLTPEAAMHQHSEKGVMSHRLDFSADTDEDAGT